MKFIVVFIVVVFIISILLYKNKKDYNIDNSNNTNIEKKELKVINNPLIKIEEINSLNEVEKNNLIEIKDNKVLAQVSNLVPSMFKTNVATQNIKSSENLYKVIIPQGEKLVDSKNLKGAKRAFYKDSKGIKGQADLIEVNKKSTIVANSVDAVMNASSLIVGDYYMNQINKELSQINNNITKIENFQTNEYKSKVLVLMTQIKKIALFQAEILETEELRNEEIANLNKLEYDCSQLLAQANFTISDFIKENKVEFEKYESTIKEIQSWCNYQENLIDILYKIVELNYTLHLGNKTKEQCSATFNVYLKHIKDIRNKLNNWHEVIFKDLNINVDKSTIKRVGFDGLIHKIPGLINDNLNYRSISKEIIEIISYQTNDYQKTYNEGKNLFKEDVNVIIKDKKIFYLPPQL